MNITDADMARQDAFLQAVAAELDTAKALHNAAKTDRDSAQKRVARAKASQDELARAGNGFDSPRFRALATIGKHYGAVFLTGNTGPMPGAEIAAQTAAVEFGKAFTESTDKTTTGGGKVTGWRHVISLGGDAERLRAALANRLDYWFGVLDNADAKKEEGRTLIARAKRCTEITGKNHKGRGVTVVHGLGGAPDINFPARGATNRDAMLAELARLARDFGVERVTDIHVLDAILDNGGKAEKVEDEKSLAADAAELIGKILDQFNGRIMADGAGLSMARALLTKIATDGMAPAVQAAPVPVNPTTLPVQAAPVANDSPDSTESAGTDDDDDDTALKALLNTDPAELTGTSPAPTPPAPVPTPPPAPSRRRGGSMVAA